MFGLIFTGILGFCGIVCGLSAMDTAIKNGTYMKDRIETFRRTNSHNINVLSNMKDNIDETEKWTLYMVRKMLARVNEVENLSENVTNSYNKYKNETDKALQEQKEEIESVREKLDKIMKWIWYIMHKKEKKYEQLS